MNVNIAPALQLDNGKSLSLEEFHRLLYDYFEDKGILSDLRTHLRAQMIRVLKDSELGNSMTNLHKTEMSPKLQAINLLIAEYLLQKQYHYSLSVFSTEVPLNTVFPNVTNELTNKELVSKFKFSESDLWDILETLGFQQHMDIAKTVSESYLKNTKDSLLKCIIASINLPRVNSQSEINLTKLVKQDYKKDLNLGSFVEALKASGLSSQITLQILEYLNVVMSTEITRIKASTQEQLDKTKAQLEDKLQNEISKYKEQVSDIEQTYANDREQLEMELKQANKWIEESQICMEEYNILKSQDQQMNHREVNVMRQEEYYNKQAKMLIDKEALLHKKLEEVEAEKRNYQRLKDKIDTNEKLIEQITLSHNKEMHTKSQQTTENINLANAVLRSQTKQLQAQIETLQSQNGVYLSRIQELALQTNSLMQELESSQQRIEQMGAQHMFPMTMVGTSNEPSVGRRCTIPSYTGGGEEGRTVTPPTGRPFRNLQSSKELRHRIQKAIPTIQLLSSSDDENVTDTVLQETKMRLENLEKESDKIDEHYEQSLKEDEMKMKSFSLLQDFHVNLTSIRQSLTRIFNRNQASTSGEKFSHVEDYTSVVYDTSAPNYTTNIKINELITEVENLDQLNATDPESSSTSTQIDLNSSLSPVELSPDISKIDPDTSADPAVWKNVGASCIVPFMIDIMLL